jgi:protocatechuate 3,4-dioxygenase beta subunit
MPPLVMKETIHTTRRKFLLGLLATVVFAQWSRMTTPLHAQSESKPPTPECPDADDVTPSSTAGPFYSPDSPLRTSLLEAGIKGTPVALTGYVLTTDCKPVSHALLDFWQADDDGEYDNVGYRLRGHQFTDEHGRYRLETIVPGQYPGRTRHIHVRLQAPDQRILTTQLYFPNEPANARDRIFRPELVMDVSDAGDAKEASFNFVLEIA